MNDFDALLAELGTMSKAASADGDQKVAAAAAEAGAKMPDGTMAKGEGEGEGEGEGDEDMMGKSFQVTMADGTTQDAYDGTMVLKAMGVRIGGLQQVISDLETDRDAANANLAKSLQASTVLLGQVKEQGELLKSMAVRLDSMATGGRGRQAALTVVDKPGATGAAGTTPAPAVLQGEIMAKAMTAFNAGTISGSEIARLEANFARGNAAPADILAQLA